MHQCKWLMLVINLVGGVAVLGSYALGTASHPEAGQLLWGGVPSAIRTIYTAGMFLAAIGYCAFDYFILFRLDPDQVRVTDRIGFGVFNIIYTGILLPSALWMPLTILTIEQSSVALLWATRLVLVLVAIASLGLFIALAKVQPRQPVWAHRVALIGSLFFCFQTVLLDAIVWGSLFQI
jgi:hypothetical protein